MTTSQISDQDTGRDPEGGSLQDQARQDANILERAKSVVALETSGLEALQGALDHHVVAAVKAILNCKGRVIISGLGKSGHIGRKIAATFVSTGTPSFFLHATEAAHGDMGIINPQDVLILLSNSGETRELIPIIEHASARHIPMIGISSNPASKLLAHATYPLCLPPAAEACPVGIAPTTSSTMTLVMGDVLAMAVMGLRGFSKDDFRVFHPGGNIGLALTRVSEIMHTGDQMPLVSKEAKITDVILEMTSKSFGIAGVIGEDGALLGVITDGDLRRHLDVVHTGFATEIMTTTPATISPDVLAKDALLFMNTEKITALFVMDALGGPEAGTAQDGNMPAGLVTVHDFLRLGLQNGG